MEFMKALPPVVDRILSLFALGIGFPETFFKDVSTPSIVLTPILINRIPHIKPVSLA